MIESHFHEKYINGELDIKEYLLKIANNVANI